MSRREVVTRLVAVGAASATGGAVAAGQRGWLLAGGIVAGGLGLALGPLLGVLTSWMALSGALVLLYGFANLGIPAGGLAVPVTDVLLGIGLVVTLPEARGQAGRRAVRLWLALATVAAVRLGTDAPRFGLLAVRDALMPAEAGFLVLGYHLARAGTDCIVRRLRWVFLVCALYFALYPVRDLLAALGPIVGIQRPVPLLGQYAGAGPAAVAGFMFMLLLRPFGRWSVLLAGAFLAELLVFQARGHYLALAAAVTLVVSFPGRGGREARVRARVAGGLALGILLAASLFPLAPSGRLGQVTPEFYVEHVGTLLGREGPGAGTIRHRLDWYRHTWDLAWRTPYGVFVGVGYGVDLTGGFTVTGGIPVRQPHNDYLEVFARTGVIGLCLFIALLASIFLPILRAARDPASGAPGTGERRFLWWVAAGLVPYLVGAAAQPLLAFPYGTVPLFTFAGMGLAAVDQVRSAVRREPRGAEADAPAPSARTVA